MMVAALGASSLSRDLPTLLIVTREILGCLILENVPCFLFSPSRTNRVFDELLWYPM